MDAKEKKIIKEFIQKLSKVWGLDEIQTIRKIARYINTQENVVIIRRLYQAIKEGE